MGSLEPDIEAYGKYARGSALADFVELLALKGRSPAVANLADYIADNGWELEDLILPAGGPGAGSSRDAKETAEFVFSLLSERAESLGQTYPFQFVGPRLVASEDLDWESNSYLALLAITIAHAFNVPTPIPAHQVFEATVTAVMKDRGLLCVNFGETRRASGGFEAALEATCGALELVANPRGAPRMKYGKDENVDVVCHLPWGDKRRGTWTLIGQVTCGKSEAWEKKIKEASPLVWCCFLNVTPRPPVFLAVPHHVETLLVERLVADADAVVIDRLRLARFKKMILPEERQIIERVREVDVESLTP